MAQSGSLPVSGPDGEEKVTREATLTELGADSLDIVESVMALEEVGPDRAWTSFCFRSLFFGCVWRSVTLCVSLSLS